MTPSEQEPGNFHCAVSPGMEIINRIEAREATNDPANTHTDTQCIRKIAIAIRASPEVTLLPLVT